MKRPQHTKTVGAFRPLERGLQLVVDRIIVEDTQLVIRHIVPTGPVRLQPRHHVVCTPIKAYATVG
jgi:hypothetical protein